MRIVNRSTGVVVFNNGSFELADLLTDLVEDVQSFEVSELFLVSARQAGLDTELLEVFLSLQAPRVRLGLEPRNEGPATLSGQIVDCRAEGLGGLAVTCQDREGRALTWAFSREDGRFELTFPEQPNFVDLELLVSARGGLLVSCFELDELPNAVTRLESFTVSTVRGQIDTATGGPLQDGFVEIWSSWAQTDSEGRFCLPVDTLGEVLDLEIFSPQGRPLGGYWTVRLPKTEPVDLGQRVVPDPAELESEPSPHPLLAEQASTPVLSDDSSVVS